MTVLDLRFPSVLDTAWHWRGQHAKVCQGPGCWCILLTWEEAHYGLGVHMGKYEGLRRA